MALVQLTYNSVVLRRQVTLNVVLPADKYYKNWNDYEEKPLKTLYLLHGYNGNFVDWNNNTRVQRYAVARNLCVVMPSGDNSFYLDYPNDEYGKFVGEELVEVTRRFFHLSHKREDTFLGGFSMGGFGALRNGLKYHDVFSHVICLSAAAHVFDAEANEDTKNRFRGMYEEFKNSDANPLILFEQLKKEKEADPTLQYPKFYVSCGTEDHLIESNRKLKKLLEDYGYDFTYYEGEGHKHDWYFWDPEILKVINDFLPLDPEYNKVFY